MPAFPYDIKFTIHTGPNAGEYGFMLVSPRGQTKSLQIEEIGPPEANRISTEAIATHQDFPPDKDTPFSQNTFASGCGQLQWDFEDDSAYWFGIGVVTHTDGKAYLAPPVAATLQLPSAGGSAISGMETYITQAGVRYDFAWSGSRLYRRNAANATNPWELVFQHPGGAAITDFTVFGGRGFICVPADTNATVDFYLQPDVTVAAPWSPTAMNHTPFSNGNKPKFVESVRGTIFAAVDASKIYYSVDPSQDGWAGPIQTTVGSITAPSVGDTSYPFVGLLAANDYLYAFKRSAGYSVDASQNITEIFWQWRNRPEILNFEFVCPSSEYILFSVSPEAYAYDPATGAVYSLRLSRRDGFSTEEILGLASDNDYVYVLARLRVPPLYNGSVVALLRGFRQRPSLYAFECLWADTAPTANYRGLAAFPRQGGSRVYWGRTSGGVTETLVMDIPDVWDESSGSSFATSGTLWSSVTYAGFPGFNKRHVWVGLTTERTSGANAIDVAYSFDGGASFTTLGAASAAAGMTLTRLSYQNLSSTSLCLRFSFSGDGSSTPVLRTFDSHQRVRFRYLQKCLAAVRLEDRVELNNGSQDSKDKQQLWDALEVLRTENGRITYEDFLGNSFDVSVDSIAVKPSRHEDSHAKPEMEAIIEFTRCEVGD